MRALDAAWCISISTDKTSRANYVDFKQARARAWIISGKFVSIAVVSGTVSNCTSATTILRGMVPSGKGTSEKTVACQAVTISKPAITTSLPTGTHLMMHYSISNNSSTSPEAAKKRATKHSIEIFCPNRVRLAASASERYINHCCLPHCAR